MNMQCKFDIVRDTTKRDRKNFGIRLLMWQRDGGNFRHNGFWIVVCYFDMSEWLKVD